jgi:hypothetical protein
MDLSNKYHDMCSKAREIQELKPCGGMLIEGTTDQHTPIQYWEAGDFFVQECDFEDVKNVVQVANGIHNDNNAERWSNHTWLPRLDQLFEIARNPTLNNYGNFKEFQAYYYKTVSIYYKDFRENNYSLEQILLKFIMQEKYNKIWNIENRWEYTEEVLNRATLEEAKNDYKMNYSHVYSVNGIGIDGENIVVMITNNIGNRFDLPTIHMGYKVIYKEIGEVNFL